MIILRLTAGGLSGVGTMGVSGTTTISVDIASFGPSIVPTVVNWRIL